MKRGDFPLQANCDPKKPSEFMAWAMVAPPRIKGAALVLSSEYCQEYSQHLWDLGFRHHKRLQKKKYRPPSLGDPHWLTNPGRWVPINEPDPPGQEVNMVSMLEAMKKADSKGFYEALNLIKDTGASE